MPRTCQVTGKQPSRGNSYTIRGIAKKKKGIGLKTTGISRRDFKPNLQKKKIWFGEENRWITLKVSTNGLRTIDKKGVATVVKELRARGEVV